MQSRKFKGALSGLAKVLAAESPLKMITFYFTSKALFLHKILNLFLGLLVMQKNGLSGKIKLISRFVTSQPAKQKLQYTYSPISQEVKAIGL